MTDDPAFLAFEAIETIIWKLPIAPVVRVVSKYFETTGTIRTIIWKPGLSVWSKESTATNLLRSDSYDKSKVLILSTPQMSREHHLVEYGPNISVFGYKLGTF